MIWIPNMFKSVRLFLSYQTVYIEYRQPSAVITDVYNLLRAVVVMIVW